MIDSIHDLRPGTWFKYTDAEMTCELCDVVYLVLGRTKLDPTCVDVKRCPDGKLDKFSCRSYYLPYYQILSEDEAAMLILGKVI